MPPEAQVKVQMLGSRKTLAGPVLTGSGIAPAIPGWSNKKIRLTIQAKTTTV